MITFFKQAGKAVCYAGLYLIMQMIGMVLVAVYAFQAIYRDVQKGTIDPLSEEQMMTQVVEYLMDNLNLSVIVAGILTLLVLWFSFAIRKKKLLQEANIVPFSPKMVMPIMLLGLASVLVVSCAFSLLPIPEEVLAEYEASIEETMSGSTVIVLLATVVNAPIVEEVIFRGLVLTRLRKVMPLTLAIITTSLVFGLFHGQILWIVYAGLLGILMSFVALQCGSVLASILFHFIFNLLGSFPIFLAFFEDSLIAMGVIEAIGLVLMCIAIGWMLKLAGGKKKVSDMSGSGRRE